MLQVKDLHVTVDGKDWAQVDLFKQASWDEVSTACPLSGCSGDLLSWDVTGWNWADRADISALFNLYTNLPFDSNSPAKITGDAAAWVSLGIMPLWAPADPQFQSFTAGWIAQSILNNPTVGAIADVRWTGGLLNPQGGGFDNGFSGSSKAFKSSFTGAWLWRPATTAVPLPSTELLFLLAFAGMRVQKYRAKLYR